MVRYTSLCTLAKSNGKIIIRDGVRISSTITKDNTYIFSLVCDPKIKTIEDVGTCAVEVRLMKILVDSLKR